MATQMQVFEWLESQLETATAQGGNEIADGVHVDDVDSVHDGELKVWLTDGTQFRIFIQGA